MSWLREEKDKGVNAAKMKLRKNIPDDEIVSYLREYMGFDPATARRAISDAKAALRSKVRRNAA